MQQQVVLAQQQVYADELATQNVLIQHYNLPPIGTRITADIPQISSAEPINGTIEGVEVDADGKFWVRVRADDGRLEPLSRIWRIQPAAQGDGTRVSPLRADDARDVVAAVEQNTHPNPIGPENPFLENDGRQSPQPKSGGMFRFLIPILIAAGLGYWAYSSWQDHLESKRIQQSVKAREQALKISIIEMASRVNAATDWTTNLAVTKSFRTSPVLTSELQKQWVTNRPIFFLGNIQDITINPDGTYQIIVGYNGSFERPMFLQNHIQINLRCPESVALPLIQAAKTRSLSAGVRADTAMTAVIDHIVTTSEKDSTGDTTAVLTGVGKCIDAMHFPESISWK